MTETHNVTGENEAVLADLNAEAEAGQDDAPAEKPKGKAKKAAPPKDGETMRPHGPH